MSHKKFNITQFIFSWVALMLMLYYALPTMIILCLGMAPTLISILTQPATDRMATTCIGMLNVCGVIPFLVVIWENHQSYQMMVYFLYNPNTWLIMYGAASVGLSIFIFCPKIVASTIRILSIQKVKQLRKHQDILSKQWGEDIRTENRRGNEKTRHIQ